MMDAIAFVLFYPRLKLEVSESLKALKSLYKDLQTKQAEAINKHPDKPVSQFACCNLPNMLSPEILLL